MKPVIIAAAVGGLVLIAGAVAMLPKEEPITAPLATPPAPRPLVREPEPQPEPQVEQVRQWQGQGGPFGDLMRQYTAEFDADRDGVLNPEEMRAAWAAFEERQKAQWDTNGDGVLSDEERRAGMEQMIRERTEAEMTRRFDRDGDGQLNDAERAEMEVARAERQARRQQWEMENYDTNKDGVITDQERADVDAARQQQREQFQSMVAQRFDADGDGQMSRLEWRSAGQTMRQEMQDARTARRVDANGDGIADSADLANWAQKIAAGDMSADLNNDGMLDQRDLQWANEAVATASTRRVDPAWEAMMAQMQQQGGGRGGMEFRMGGPGMGGPGGGGPGGPGGGGDRMMFIGGPGMVIEGRPVQGTPTPQTTPAPGR